MRIWGPSNASAAAAQVPRRAASGGFSLPEGESTPATGHATGLRTVGGIDALMALQGVEDPTERRRRAVKHGRNVLDLLDDLKLSFLAGSLDQSGYLRLKAAAAGLAEGTGDPRLDGVLAEIDLRAAVELAKAGIR